MIAVQYDQYDYKPKLKQNLRDIQNWWRKFYFFVIYVIRKLNMHTTWMNIYKSCKTISNVLNFYYFNNSIRSITTGINDFFKILSTGLQGEIINLCALMFPSSQTKVTSQKSLSDWSCCQLCLGTLLRGGDSFLYYSTSRLYHNKAPRKKGPPKIWQDLLGQPIGEGLSWGTYFWTIGIKTISILREMSIWSYLSNDFITQ